MNRWILLIFWIIVIGLFIALYFFFPSFFNEIQQTTYQNTPYVNTP